jgi:hypothetical protein
MGGAERVGQWRDEGVDQMVVDRQVGGEFGGQFVGQVVRQLCPQVDPQGSDKVGRQVADLERIEGEQRLVGRRKPLKE